MPYAETMLSGVAGAVVVAARELMYGAGLVACVLAAVAAALFAANVAVDRLRPAVHVVKGIVLAAEQFPVHTTSAYFLGGITLPVVIPPRFILHVRTPHGEAAFAVGKDEFETFAVGVEVMVAYGVGRYSGRMFPREVLV